MRSDPHLLAPAETSTRVLPPKELELELYRSIFNSANDAVAVIDANGFYLEQNPAHERLIGYSDGDLNGQTPAIHLGEETFALVASELARTGRFHGEVTSRTRWGEEIVIALSAFTMYDEHGGVLCHVGMKRDVSDRRRVNEELKTRAWQQAVVARLGQAALSGQELGELMQDAVSSVAQVLSSEFIKVLELLPGGRQFVLRAGVGWKHGCVGSAKVENDPLSQAGYTLHSSSPVIVEDLRTEVRFRGAQLLYDHNVISGISVAIPVRGRPWGVLTVHTAQLRKYSEYDVNFLVAVTNVLAAAIERHQAEEALQESENRFRRVQRSASIAAYELDLRTDELTWSEQLPAFRGLAPDRKLETWLSRVHPDDRARVREVFDRALSEGSEFDIEMRMVTVDGDVLWLTTRGQVFSENGYPAQVSGIVMDVTARKNTEELLQRSEKLAMVGRLAASIAHEINNPLESVTNLLYLIEHHPGLHPTACEYARLASAELSRVAHISRQTLGFYRESSNPMLVDVTELLDDVIQLYSRKLEHKRIRLQRVYGVNRQVRVYPNEIRQVVSNLLMNSVEASPEGSIITIRAESGRCWGRPEVRGVRIIVADNGHGIAKQNRRKIFEPFFTTKGEKGTGLGLWVSNGLVHKHGGSIRLRSSTRPERHGTVFAVFVPDPAAAAEVTPPTGEARSQNVSAAD